MKLDNRTRLALIIILCAILAAGIIVFVQKQQTVSDTQTPVRSVEEWSREYNEQFPLLRTIDFGDDIKGVSSPVHNDWFAYENKALGFRIEYPRRAVYTDQLKPYETVYNDTPSGKSYHVGFSSLSDTDYISLTIQPSRFRDIWEWKKNNPEYGAVNTVFTRRQLGDINAMITYSVPEFPYLDDEHMEHRVHFIKDDILYTIITLSLPVGEREYIWDSFRFFD